MNKCLLHSFSSNDLYPFVCKCQNITKDLFDDHLRTSTELTTLEFVKKKNSKNLKTQLSFLMLACSNVSMIFKVIYDKHEIEKQFKDSLCEILPKNICTPKIEVDNFMKEYCNLSTGKIKEVIEKKIYSSQRNLQLIKDLETKIKNNTNRELKAESRNTFHYYWKFHSNILEVNCILEVNAHQCLDVNTLNSIVWEQTHSNDYDNQVSNYDLYHKKCG
ncbi:MAG: hypothetical protein HQK49_05485 [Oligoflexia bacterium]|nr:hypothetical protein [Oligoflexia bacterium]